MQNKRGISNIIATILIILLAILAIAIIWAIIYNFLRDSGEVVQAKNDLLQIEVEIDNVDIQSNSQVELTLESNQASKFLINAEIIEQAIPADIVLVTDISLSMADFYCEDSLGTPPPKGTDLDSEMGQYITTSEDAVCPLQGNGYPDFSCYYNELVNNGESICTNQFSGDKWQFPKLVPVKIALTDFINSVFSGGIESEGKSIGLVSYETTANPDFSHILTDSATPLIIELSEWYPSGTTCICCGINEAINKLSNSEKENKVVILLSDGEAKRDCTNTIDMNDKNQALLDTIQSAKDAEGAGIVIHTIAYTDEQNLKDLMQQIATETNGQSFTADISNLIDIYTQVERVIQEEYDTAERTDHLRIVFYNETDTAVSIITELPQNPLERKKYTITVTPPIENINKIEVYPVIVTKSGKVVVADNAVDSWSLTN